MHGLMQLKALPAWLIVILIFVLTIFMYKYHNELTYFKTADHLEDYSEVFQQPAVNFLEITRNGCVWPLLSPNEKEILPLVNYQRSIHCNSSMPKLASLLDDGRLLITAERGIWRRNLVPEFTCSVRSLYGAAQRNSAGFSLGDEIEVPYNVPTSIPYDQFVVQCFNKTTNEEPIAKIYERTFVNYAVYPKERFDQPQTEVDNTERGVAEAIVEEQKEKDEEEKRIVAADPMYPSLAILALDSASLNQFLRQMPETFEYMQKKHFVTMNMYNKGGYGTASNLLPVLAGRPMPVHLNNPENEYVILEDVEFIWDIMKDRGCITMLNDDIMDPALGLLNYKNHTFQDFSKPTDFYLKPYHAYNSKHGISPDTNGQCLKDGTITSVEYLSNMFEFSKVFKDYCHFSFNFLADKHEEHSNTGSVDHHLRVTLERFFDNGIADNTALIIMSDHGNRINDIKGTFTGRVEERNPFFAIHLPEKYRKTNVEKFYNLRLNANRLISNYDIHKLLREIALGPNEGNDPPEWGVPLLSEQVHWNRTCEMAHIPTNNCLCMEYYEERSNTTTNETDIFDAASEIMQNYLSELPCLTKLEMHDDFDHLRIYSLNQMVLQGLRDQGRYAELINTTVEADIEFLEFKMRAFSPPRSRDGAVFNFGSMGRLKHYKRTGEMELCASPRVIERSVPCHASFADQICEMCYTDNLAAPVNELLLD